MNNNEEIILHGTGYQILKDIVIKINQITVQSRFSDNKFSDNLWFSDYFTKNIFQ